MTILDYLRKLFHDDPELKQYDISEGSNYYDLVYTTINKILAQSVLGDMITWSDVYNINDLSRLPYSDLAKVASQYGVPIPVNNESTGDIVLVFNDPYTVTLPAGTIFSAGSVDYILPVEETIMAEYLMASPRTSDNKYQAQPITVFNQEGSGAEANTIGTISISVPGLARIEHAAIASGTSRVSLNVLTSIIKGVVRGATTGTDGGIAAALQGICSSIKAIEVVGHNSPHMKRNLLVNAYIYGYPSRNKQDFENKIYGNTTTNKNIAYRGVLYTQNPPHMDAIYGKTELSQYQYICLGDSDRLPLAIETNNHYTDKFSSYNNFGARGSIDGDIMVGDDFFYAHGEYWIEPGITVDIDGTDEGGDIQRTKVLIKETEIKTMSIKKIEVSGTTYTVTIEDPNKPLSDAAKKLRYGQIIELMWININGNNPYSITVEVGSIPPGGNKFTFLSSISYPVGDTISGDPGRAIWQENRIVGMFGISMTASHVSMPNDGVSQVGDGWIVSEHGYPVGMTLSDRSVYVENERVVFGGNTETVEDPLKNIIRKGGTPRFVSAILKSIQVKKTKIAVQQIAHISESYEIGMEK